MKHDKKTPTRPSPFLLIAGLTFIYYSSFCQNGVGIGIANPDASAVLQVQPPANNKGLLIPRLTILQRNSITSPAEGLLVYVIDPAPPSAPSVEGFYFSNAGTWYPLSGWVKGVGTNNVSLAGNASITGTVSAANYALNATGNGPMPQGGIIMWSGSIASIPTGWALCNGQPGTPDLRDRFIVGAGSSYAPGVTGGANTVALTTAEMPSHGHPMATSGNHEHSYMAPLTSGSHPGGSNGYDRPNGIEPGVTANDGSHTHPIGSTGGGSAHENRPPYYALAYIIKL